MKTLEIIGKNVTPFNLIYYLKLSRKRNFTEDSIGLK